MPQNATSTQASTPIPQNGQRVSLFMLNLDGTDNIFVDTTNRVGTITTANAGIRLSPGAAFAVNRDTDGLPQIQDSWQAIASANTPTLAWFETSNFNQRTGKFELSSQELLALILNILEQQKNQKRE